MPVAREITAAMSLSVTSAPSIAICSEPDARDASFFSKEGMTAERGGQNMPFVLKKIGFNDAYLHMLIHQRDPNRQCAGSAEGRLSMFSVALSNAVSPPNETLQINARLVLQRAIDWGGGTYFSS